MEEAVARSGYPVQTEVALALLARGLDVHEEWSYADRDTEKLRAIDLMATKTYETSDDKLVPRLALVIECKRSEMPYVFFRSAKDRLPPEFPAIYGLPRTYISITGANGSTDVYPAQAFGIDDMEFSKDGSPIVTTFAKVEPKKNHATLSGEDVFSGILMPLTGAMGQAETMLSWWGSKDTRYPALTLGICVLDAPMFLADSRKKPHDLALVPWVRVARQEVVRDAHPSERKVRYFAFDVVHFDFWDAFLDQHVLPLGGAFQKRMDDMKAVVHRGGGQVADLSSWKWSDVRG